MDRLKRTTSVRTPLGPTPKGPGTLRGAQWGVVERTLVLARTSVLQKMGKAETTKYTTSLKENNKLAKYLETYYDNIIKTSKKFCGRISEYAIAGICLTDVYHVLAVHFEDEKALGQAFHTVAESLRKVDKLRETYQFAINNKFITTTEAFFDGPIKEARDAKKKFRRALMEFDAAENKLREAQSGTNLSQLYSAYHYHHKYKRRMLARQHEAESQLSDMLQRHNFEFLQYLIDAMNAQYDFYNHTYTIWYDQDAYFNQLKQYSLNHRTEYARTKAKRQQDMVNRAKQEDEEKYDDLVEILSSPDLVVVNSICVSAGADQDVILEDLVRILDAYKKTLPIIKIGISKEIQSTASAQTLFRGNSTATKLMSAFTRLTGRPYLVSTLQPLIRYITADPKGYEVDPSKIKGAGTVESGMQKLTAACRVFLTGIFSSLPKCPIPFREMAHHLQAEVVKRWPDHRTTAVGGFIFLRFFCPVILTPEAHGIVEASTLDNDARRALVLISKSLQNLSNGIQFGAKETYMNDMNKFILENMGECRGFLDTLAQVPTATDYVPLANTDEVRAKQLPSLHKLLIKNLEKITKSLTQHNEQNMILTLVACLGQLGDP